LSHHPGTIPADLVLYLIWKVKCKLAEPDKVLQLRQFLDIGWAKSAFQYQ